MTPHILTLIVVLANGDVSERRIGVIDNQPDGGLGLRARGDRRMTLSPHLPAHLLPRGKSGGALLLPGVAAPSALPGVLA